MKLNVVLPNPICSRCLVKMLVASKDYHVVISINIHVVSTEYVTTQEYGVAC